MREDQEVLRDILEAIERIERHSGKGKLAFERDELIQTWMIHHLQIIGEAASQLGKTIKAANPHIDWIPIVAMRKVLVHRYFGVDLDEVWIAVERDLPVLKRQIEALLRDLGEPGKV
jgi:uncharacterized protein with HEPN domain